MSKGRMAAEFIILALVTVITTLVCETVIFISAVPCALMLMTAIAYASSRFGTAGGAAASALFLLTAFLAGSKTIVVEALLVIPVSVACGMAVRKKTPFYEALLNVMSSFLIGIVLASLFVRVREGLSAGGYVVLFALELCVYKPAGLFFAYPMLMTVKNGLEAPGDRAVKAMYEMILNGGTEATRTELTEEGNRALLEGFFDTLVPVFSIYAVIAGGLLLFIITRWLMKKAEAEVCEAPGFQYFQLPGKSGTVILVTLIACSVLKLFKIEGIELFLTVVSQGCVMLFMIQGISVLAWIASRFMGNRAAAFAACMLALAFGSGAGYAGIAEQILKMRENALKKSE